MSGSARRAAVGVALVTAVGIDATLADAQTVQVKEKPSIYRYVSYWASAPARPARPGRDGASDDERSLAAALADGTLTGYGDEENQVHSTDGFTYDNWAQARSLASLMKMVDGLHKRAGASSAPVSPATHWDQIYTASFYNWKAGSWRGAYGYSGTFRLKPEASDPDDAIHALSSFYVPVFEKMLSDGIIVEYELDREMFHETDKRNKVHFSFVLPNAEGIDRFRAALGDALDANPLIVPAAQSMLQDQTEQFVFVKVNATFK